MSSAVRAWAKRVGYPDVIELTRIEASQKELPAKASSFVDWLFTLTDDNALASHGITPEEYDQEVIKSSGVSGNSMVLNVDEEFAQVQSYLSSLDEEIQRTVADNQTLERKLRIISAEKVKQGTSTDSPESASNAIKLLPPVDAHVHTTKEHEHALRAVSSKILEVEPQAGKQLHKLRSVVQ